MDGEHRLQAQTLRVLEGAIRRGAEPEVVDGLLLSLLELTRAHFVAEEHLMQRSRYPGQEAHAAEHRQLLKLLAGLRQKYAGGQRQLALEVVELLKPWLHDHIQGMDRALALHLGRHSVRHRLDTPGGRDDEPE